MTDSDKLEFLVATLRREILFLEPSQEIGLIELRERMENDLIKIGIEPYENRPMVALFNEIDAIEDENHYSRYGF